MKAFCITGGVVSPSCVIVAKNIDEARRNYNKWLMLTYGREDQWVSVSELEPGKLFLHQGGGMVYHYSVRGYQDEKFVKGCVKHIPKTWPVQPLKADAPGKTTCGYCGLSWDDNRITSMTPAPAGRCPFEYFHV